MPSRSEATRSGSICYSDDVSDIEERPIPKALIWGLIAGFILFVIILVVIVMNRDKSEAPPVPQSSESRSESPPQ